MKKDDKTTTPMGAPENRAIDALSQKERREKMLDKTIADSFPASDPPSSLPNPDGDSFVATPYVPAA